MRQYDHLRESLGLAEANGFSLTLHIPTKRMPKEWVGRDDLIAFWTALREITKEVENLVDNSVDGDWQKVKGRTGALAAQASGLQLKIGAAQAALRRR